jgi:hypothetical protein
MPPVFGRTHPDPHPYDDALETWLKSGDSSWQSMARNVMHDHRVSEPRAEAFDHFVDHPCTSAGLNRAIVDYFDEQIRHRKLPHYVYKAANENNLLTSRGLLPLIQKDVKLVRAVDLNGLRFVCQWANDPSRRKKSWEPMLARFPASLTDSEITRWLDSELGGASPMQIERTVSTMLDIINSYRDEEPYQPAWATTWTAFEPHESGGPERWLQVLGVANPPPRWVMLLSYTVAEAGTLVRPTILDADWYAYHFPSPPQASLALGGHPMDLRIAPGASYPLPEYIHKQISHTLVHWTDLGGKIGRTSSPNPTSLADQRRAHLDLLVNSYGPNVLSWMSSPL